MLYEKYTLAWDTQGIDMLESLCHPDFEMVMHSSGSVASKISTLIVSAAHTKV